MVHTDFDLKRGTWIKWHLEVFKTIYFITGLLWLCQDLTKRLPIHSLKAIHWILSIWLVLEIVSKKGMVPLSFKSFHLFTWFSTHKNKLIIYIRYLLRPSSCPLYKLYSPAIAATTNCTWANDSTFSQLHHESLAFYPRVSPMIQWRSLHDPILMHVPTWSVEAHTHVGQLLTYRVQKPI